MDNLLSQKQFEFNFDYLLLPKGDIVGDEARKFVRDTCTAALTEIEALRANLLITQNSLRLVSMLASDTPQFHNPIDAMKAKMIRDMVLAIPAPPTDKETTS